jgi:hypothetical protein
VIDADDYAKEDCECGHRRHSHVRGTGACRQTRVRRVAPEGLTWSGEGFDCEPSIPIDQWPQVEGPCCTAFEDAGLARAEAGP